eukprot:747139-Hanusia_phi.AAC.2
MSLSFIACHRGWRSPSPNPMWQYITPAFPLSIPPTRQSDASSRMRSEDGWDPLWSEMAHSPTPMHCSSRQMSRRTDPVMVGEGMR